MALQEYQVEIYPSLGQNDALNPAQLPQGAQRRAYDAIQKSIGTIGKRPGSRPVTQTALGSDITYLTTYKTSPSDVSPNLFAVSGTTLYKWDGAVTLVPQTMTNAFASSAVFSIGFTDATNQSRLILTDGGVLKAYDGTAVANVTPAANDPNPAPPNYLATLNAKGIKYCWSHTGHVFLTDGSDTIWYTKRYTFDYVPSVQYERFVQDNDYITGPGITYNNLCLIPMRWRWGVLIGEVFNDGTVPNGFSGNNFLNTVNGNISPRGMTKITYPDGTQTVAYLSDDGVNEIYDTGFEDTGTRQYATKSLMKDKLDFIRFGFLESELKAAVCHFDPVTSLLTYSIRRNATTPINYQFVYDVRNQQWYVWRLPWETKAQLSYDNAIYFGGTLKLLQTFNDQLYSDWSDYLMTTGTPVDFDVYSGLLSFEFTGDPSYVHYYLVESAQFIVKSTLDVYIIYGSGTVDLSGQINNEILIWNVSAWNQGQWANLDFTDVVNNAKRLVIHKRSKYFQRRWRNNRNEPAVVLKEKFVGSVSGRL